MLTKNSYVTGFLAALIFPAIACGADYYFRYTAEVINRPALPYLVAVALNLLAMRFIFKYDYDKTGKAMMATTFIVMITVFIVKGHVR